MLAGDLAIRDSEPGSLEQPTTISGTVDDESGAIAVSSFDTPTVTFERAVTSPITATAVIDASFTEVGPGTGSIDSDGNLAVSQAVTVDIHVEVFQPGSSTPIEFPGDCRATPIALELLSATGAPYDHETGRVTVTDADFTIPAVPATAGCDATIANAINDALEGPGHSLSLTLAGALPLPSPVGCTTFTTLTATPAGSSELASPLELDAAVTTDAQDPECVEALEANDLLSGDVDFLADGVILGSAPLDGGGVATFTTSNLPAGAHELTARFRRSGTYLLSTSDPVAHTITAPPAVTSNLRPFVQVGSGPVEFDVDLNATDLAAPVTGGHLDLTLAYTNNGLIFDTYMSVEVLQGETWVPVTLTAIGTSRALFGRVADLDIAPSTVSSLHMRTTFGAPNPATPSAGQLGLTFEYVPAEAAVTEAPAPGALARGTVQTTLTTADRLATFLQANPIVPSLSPHTTRQGSTVVIGSLSIRPSAPAGHVVSGYAEYFLDGAPIDVTPATAGLADEGRRLAVFGSTTPSAMMQLSPSITPGTHVVTIRYLGDALYQPAQLSVNLTVLASLGGTHYECRAPGSPAHRFRAAVVAQGNLPATAPAGTDVAVDHLAVRMLTDRGQRTVSTFGHLVPNNATTPVGSVLQGVAFDFGPDGTGSATSIARSGGVQMPVNPNPATDVDHVIDPQGETATVSVSGAVGDVLPVTLERIRIDMRETGTGFTINVVCVPVVDPIYFGDVRVSGVDLSVTPAGPTRAGDDVVLTADVGFDDADGVLELRTGTTTLGVVPVDGAVTTFTTDDLGVGEHSLTARYFPQPAGAVQVSAAVAHTVWPEHECPEFTDAGSGAVVRLVYLELLGRCPDQAGFDHWVGRLDGGTSPEGFARTIARTPEAVGRVVDDAYQTMLGRPADPAGRAFWVGRLRASGRYDQLLADLGASGEFWAKAGASNDGFVTRVYGRLLNRAPDAGGLAYWTDRLETGTSRRALILVLANLDEPLGRLVAGSYDEILGRAPFAGERADGIAFLRSTGDRSGLYAELIGRPEFTTRAGTFPNPED